MDSSSPYRSRPTSPLEASGSVDACQAVYYADGRPSLRRGKKVPGACCRAMDLGIVLLISPLLLVVGLGVAAWIRMVSPGFVLFSQTRIGYLGRRFTIFKFRSMREHAETRDHEDHVASLAKSNVSLTKLDDTGDGRLFPGSRFLRKTALDELPQVINVLRGEMSIIGPRPCLEYEYALYDEAQRERFGALPGMTGYWQVNGKNSTTFEQMVKLDIYYVRHRSPWLNLCILLRTPLVLVQQALGLRPRVRLPSDLDDIPRPNKS